MSLIINVVAPTLNPHLFLTLINSHESIKIVSNGDNQIYVVIGFDQAIAIAIRLSVKNKFIYSWADISIKVKFKY